jgi:hypothetical protein
LADRPNPSGRGRTEIPPQLAPAELEQKHQGLRNKIIHPEFQDRTASKKNERAKPYHLYGVERRQAKGRKKELPSACSKKTDQERSPKQARVCN